MDRSILSAGMNNDIQALICRSDRKIPVLSQISSLPLRTRSTPPSQRGTGQWRPPTPASSCRAAECTPWPGSPARPPAHPLCWTCPAAHPSTCAAIAEGNRVTATPSDQATLTRPPLAPNSLSRPDSRPPPPRTWVRYPAMPCLYIHPRPPSPGCDILVVGVES